MMCMVAFLGAPVIDPAGSNSNKIEPYLPCSSGTNSPLIFDDICQSSPVFVFTRSMYWYFSTRIGKATLLKKGSKTAILSNGFIGRNVTLAITEISNATLFSHYDFSFVKPLDEELLHSIFKEYENIVTIEDGTIIGGFGSAIAEFKSKYKYKNDVQILGIPDQFIEQGTVEELQRFSEINVKSLVSILSTYRK